MAKKKTSISNDKPIIVGATEKQLILFEKNYAGDTEIADRFMDRVVRNIQNARNNRKTMEDQWIDDLRLWSCRLDGLGYNGRANIFVPELHSQVEMSVEKAMSATFPGPDLIQAIGVNGTPQKEADLIANAVAYELEEKARLFGKHEEFSRAKVLFGTGIYKGGFRKEMREVFTRDPKTGKPIKDQVPKYHGVTWDVVDLFRWYIYPETGNLLDHELIFEDQWIPKSDVDKMADKMDFVNVDQISTDTFDPYHNWVDAERLEIVNIVTAASVRKDYVFLTEIWMDFALDGKNEVPCQAFVANDRTLVLLRRNQFWDQSHPYLGERYIRRPGKIFYGFSLPDKIRSQQYQMNDVNNQGMDSLTYTMNPITVFDPALVGDINGMKFFPGARWLGDVNGVKPIVFPDTSGSALRMMQEIRGQIAQFSDTQPGVAPQLQGKARSATQADIIQKNVSAKQRMSGKIEELSVLTPMCLKTHSHLKQFMEQKWQIKYQGPEYGEWIVQDVTPSTIWGQVDWIWKGSSAEERNAIRSQQLLGFYNMMVQAAAVMPGEIDLSFMAIKIAREAFNLRDLDEAFKSLKNKKTVDPNVENLALLMNRDVVIHTGDDDKWHIEVVQEIIDDPKVSDEIKLKAIQHREAHKQQEAAKLQIRELEAQAAAQAQAASGGEPGGPGAGPGGPPSPLEGNQGQVPNSPADVMTGVKGVQPNL